MAIVGVVGLGAMGLGIAQVYAQAGYLVRATDARPDVRDGALARLGEGLMPRVAAGKMAMADLNAILARITIAESTEAFVDASMVVEAILEDLTAKRRLLTELEMLVRPECVLASNTSALSLTDIAQGMLHPDRLIGLHFFNPAPVMKLVELVAHAGTSVEAVAFARRLTENAGKVVVGCADRPGFIVNRCARPFYGEALAMMEEGRTAAEIDAAVLAAGYRMGPFTLIDLIGADINLAATEGLSRAMGDHPRYHVFSALRKQVESGNLGRKTGRGFLWPDQPGVAPLDGAAIVARIEAVMINEAATLVEEGDVSPADVDAAMRLGLNFPHGPFEAMGLHGKPQVLALLESLKASTPIHLRGRYDAAELLKEQA